MADVGKLVCAALLGAAVALPVGMMLAGVGSGEPRTRAAPPAAGTGRAVYSPKVLSDPYFLEQQRKGAEALETRCRAAGEMCAEAGAARRWLAEHGG
jgi:hypothetical protein